MVLGEYGDNPLLILFIILLFSALILNYIIGWSRPNKKARKSRMDGNRGNKFMGRGDMSPQGRGLKKRETRRTNKEVDDNGTLEEDCDYLSDEDFGVDGLCINSPNGDGPSMSHYHNKGPTTESQALIDRYLAKVNFNMTSEDLDQPWFHKCATREIAEELLKGGMRGSFLVRPSSRRGSYAMSWMKDVASGEIGHSLIYGLFPGFSLKQTPDMKERFWSIQSLIEHCAYLTSPVICADYLGTNGSLGNNYAKTSSEVIGRMVEKLGANDPSLVEVRWNISILGEGPENYNSSRCEKRTYVRYCDEEYAAPELLPLNGNGLRLVAEAAISNTTLRTLSIVGHEGYLRMNFKPILGDDEVKAIAKLLESNKHLTSLNLSVNNITDVGVKALAKSLKFNRTLRRLNLSQNFITSHGLAELSEILKSNSSIEELDTRNQLHRAPMSGGCVTLACGDKEKTLIGMIDYAMKRRTELLGAQPSAGSSLASSNGASPARIAPLGVYHGYLSRKKVDQRLADQSVGKFLFYLNRYIPNVVFVAAVMDDTNSSKKIVHKRILRTRQGYVFASGSSLRTSSEKINGYVHPKPGVPSLFEHCAWYIASKPELIEAADEYLADDIKLRLHDVQLLLGLWGVKDAPPYPLNTVHNTNHTNHPPHSNGFSSHPLYNNHNNNNNNHHHNHNNHSPDSNKHKQGSDVYPTLSYLVQRNKAWLCRPLHVQQESKPPDELNQSV